MTQDSGLHTRCVASQQTRPQSCRLQDMVNQSVIQECVYQKQQWTSNVVDKLWLLTLSLETRVNRRVSVAFSANPRLTVGCQIPLRVYPRLPAKGLTQLCTIFHTHQDRWAVLLQIYFNICMPKIIQIQPSLTSYCKNRKDTIFASQCTTKTRK